MILIRVLRTSIGVPADRQIQELCCLNVKFNQKNSISVCVIKLAKKFQSCLVDQSIAFNFKEADFVPLSETQQHK